MKKIIKSKIFLCVIVGIIFTSLGVYGASKYNASEVIYNPSNGNSITVSDALNELYEKDNSSKNEIYIPSISYQNGYKSSGNTSYLDMVHGYTEIDVSGYTTLIVTSIISTADYSTTAADIIGFDFEGNQTTLHSGVTNNIITLDITDYEKIEFYGETRAKTGNKKLTFNEIYIK